MKNNKNSKNNNFNVEDTVDIDFEMFTTEELVTIYHFYHLMENTRKSYYNKKILLQAYQEYRKVINSIALEKKYDREFEKKTGLSIYQTIKSISE